MKPWSPRFTTVMADPVFKFNASLEVDQRLYQVDIMGSLAHARELMRIGILSPEEGEALQKALIKIYKGIESGSLAFKPEYEDIHMGIEQMLIAEVGDLGKKLHTGRSRNDQVALDTKLFLKQELPVLTGQLVALMSAIHGQALNKTEQLMPGFTHMMGAQPISLAFHLLTYCEMLHRDHKRFAMVMDAADAMPLGAGALSGSGYPLDREAVAKDLGFGRLAEHAMDAISDRDYVIDAIYASAMTMQHLSRLCEELILWSSPGFGFVRISDAFCTGSSIMPQKRNPDTLELIRGKTGRVYGHLMGMLTVMKGLPLAYNKDMQEDKAALFDSLDTAAVCLEMMTGVIGGLTFNGDKMEAMLDKGFLNATELADYLAAKGMPFREAHHITGQIVLYAEEQGQTLEALSLETYQSFSMLIEADVFTALAYENAINKKLTLGSTSQKSVTRMLKTMGEIIDALKGIDANRPLIALK